MNLDKKLVIFQVILNLFLSMSLMLILSLFINLHLMTLSFVIGLCLFNAIVHLFIYSSTLMGLYRDEQV